MYNFQSLIGLYDKKTGKRIPGRPRYCVVGSIVVSALLFVGLVLILLIYSFTAFSKSKHYYKFYELYLNLQFSGGLYNFVD